MTDAISPLASDLCTACGLCCSGPIFNCIDLEADEVEPATQLGLQVSTYRDGGPILEFPCSKLIDKCCAVYEERPSRCRTFRCELLMRLDRDEVAIDDAIELVDSAWAATRRVEAELGDESIRDYRRRRAEALYERGEALPHTPARDRLNDLDAILDEHFRKPMQNQTTPFDDVEGRDGWITVTGGFALAELQTMLSGRKDDET